MNRLFILALLILTLNSTKANALVRGADISWCTEMENDGVKFYNTNGRETDIFALMKEIGMSAIRLRVWVDPATIGYGAYSDKADVVEKAKRAHGNGLDIMVDFHYSDFFVDPGVQTTPALWKNMSLDELKTAVANHTADVLQALKDEGIEPRWVQVGNETNNGMLWPTGKIDWDKSGTERYANYVALNNAGYDAVKSVFRNAKVILHIANAYNAGSWDGWFFKDITAAGAKFDIIGLSHYPDYEQWNSNVDDAVSNANAANSVATLGKLYNVPVMICETGYSTYDPERARTVMQDLLKRMEAIPQCAGIFYWEPETDGKWKPAYYNNIGWEAYSMGAFSEGRPTAALDPFRDGNGAVSEIAADNAADEWFDLQGWKVIHPERGVYIRKQGADTQKVVLR